MLVKKINDVIYRLYFKNCIIYVNSGVGVFLSKNTEILSINKKADTMLLEKFHVECWDDYNEKLDHIKFLIKYSPILSRFVDDSELNDIKLINKEDKDFTWDQHKYLKINDKKFFDTSSTVYGLDSTYMKFDENFKNQYMKIFQKKKKYKDH